MMKKKTRNSLFWMVLALILLLIFLFPYYYMVIQSFLPWEKVDKTVIPSGLSLKSYYYLIGKGGSGNPFMWVKALMNSFIVSAPTAVLSVAVGLLTGYASAKMEYRGKGVIQATLLFQMFFPVIVLLVPRYMIVKPLANTYGGMIMPLCISIWGIFMYINYFKTVPNSIFEAARIDGASEIKNIYFIALPATKSISIIVFLSIFMTRWCELMWDMLIAPGVDHQTLNVMISNQFNQNLSLPGPMYASSVVLTLPIIILFLCFSKYFKEGINFMLK